MGKTKTYKVVSLFSGAGGLDSGFYLNRVFTTMLANDIRLTAGKTFTTNYDGKLMRAEEFNNRCFFKDLPAYIVDDVHLIDFRKLPVEVDVVIGGPPCQDFSVVRGVEEERQGTNTKRGKLYAQFVRAVQQTQPKVFVFENVPGLKSANKGEDYQTILNSFTNIGYEIMFSDVLDAVNFGVPQKRKRLIIIGIKNDLVNERRKEDMRKMLNSKLSEKTILYKLPITPIEVFEGKVLPDLNTKYREVMLAYSDININTERAKKWKTHVWDKLSFDIIEDYLQANNVDAYSMAELDNAFEEHDRILQLLGYKNISAQNVMLSDNSSCIITKELETTTRRLQMIPPGENHLFVRGTDLEISGIGMSMIYRRLHPLKPSYTVTAYGGGGTWGYHYERNRGKLTNRERARLQTFPDSFLFQGTSSEVRAQIGEAVPTLLSLAIANAVYNILTFYC